MSDTLTVGLREQYPVSTGQFYLDFNVLTSTFLGTFFGEAALTTLPEETIRISFFGRHTYANPLHPKWGTFGLAARYSRTVTSADPAETGAYSFSCDLNYSKPLPGDFSVSPSLLYGIDTAGRWQFRGRTLFRKAFRGGTALSFDVELNWAKEETPSWTGTLSFSASFPELNQTLLLRQDVAEGQFYANWNRFPPGDEGMDFSATLQAPFDQEERTVGYLSAGHTSPYTITQISHRGSAIFADPEESKNITRFSLQTAGVYAGGLFALTTPFQDSFLLVERAEVLEDRVIRINPSGAEEAPERPGPFPELLKGLHSYQPKALRIEVEDLPPGVDLGEQRYYFIPSYRSAAVLTLAPTRTLYAGGRLVDRKGESGAYLAGEIQRVGEEGVPVGEFFTDETGSFEIYQISPGEYVLVVLFGGRGRYRISLPEDTLGYYALGDVKELLPEEVEDE